MSKSVPEIVEEARRRVSNDQQRIQIYDRCRAAYFGSMFGDHPTKAMDNTGRPLDRADQLRRGISTLGAPNLIQPLIDDFVSLKGQVPVMSVVPEADGKEAKDIATKRSRILRAQWEQSHMLLQMREWAFHVSGLGDAVFSLDPLFPPTNGKLDDPIYEGGLKPPGVYITVIDPAICYPQFRTGVFRHELDSLIVAWRTDRDTALATWPGLETYSTEIDVIQYYDQHCKHTIVDQQQMEYVEHNLGFCPAQWCGNKVTGKPGQSDVAQILDQHEEYQVMTRVANDALILATYPITWIKNPLEFNDQLPIGPGAVIPMGAEGQIGQLAPAATPQVALELIQNQVQRMEQQAGSAPVRVDSSIDHSNISSRAIHAVQGPMESRLSSFQDIAGFAVQSLNAKILLMLAKLAEFQRPMTVFSMDKGGKETVTFTGEDLGGWWRTSVDWDTSAGNKHERIVQSLQLHGQRIVPRSYVAEQAGIADPEQMISEADDEFAKLNAGQPQPGGQPGQPQPDQVQQQLAQPGEQANAGMAGGQVQPPAPAPPGVDPGAQGGGGGSPPSAPPGFAPLDTPPTQPGVGSPAPMDDPFAMIEQVITQLQDQLQGGPPNVTVKGGKIIVEVGSWKDSSVVKKALAELGTRVKVQVAKQTAGGR